LSEGVQDVLEIMDPYNILIVDDELGNLNALERTFRREYNVFSATSGEDALSIISQNDIALIVSDHCMPGMTGVELLEEARQKYPNIVRIILTAYTDDKAVADAVNKGHVFSLMSKPWNPNEMRAIVKEGIKIYQTTC
jgi:adenylate cyclase